MCKIVSIDNSTNANPQENNTQSEKSLGLLRFAHMKWNSIQIQIEVTVKTGSLRGQSDGNAKEPGEQKAFATSLATRSHANKLR